MAPYRVQVIGMERVIPLNFYRKQDLPRELLAMPRRRDFEAGNDPVVFAQDVGGKSMQLSNAYFATGWSPTQDDEYGKREQSWSDGGFALFTMEQAFSCNELRDTNIITTTRPDYTDQSAKVDNLA